MHEHIRYPLTLSSTHLSGESRYLDFIHDLHLDLIKQSLLSFGLLVSF